MPVSIVSPLVSHRVSTQPAGSARTGATSALSFGSSLQQAQRERREAFLQQTLFQIGTTPYTGQDILYAVEQAVRKRSRNLFLWVVAPLWVLGEECHPRYVSLEKIKAALPNVATNEAETRQYHDGVEQAVATLVKANILKTGSAGDWLGMGNRLTNYAVVTTPRG